MYTMKEACKLTGMTYEALKFYCNAGLIPNLQRDGNNRRVFSENAISWIRGIIALRKCGMSIQEMREYTQLCIEGQSSIPVRKLMLEKRRALLLEQIDELNKSIQYIDEKQQFYDDVLSGKTEYHSYLTAEDRERACAERREQ